MHLHSGFAAAVMPECFFDLPNTNAACKQLQTRHDVIMLKKFPLENWVKKVMDNVKRQFSRLFEKGSFFQALSFPRITDKYKISKEYAVLVHEKKSLFVVL